MQTGDVVIVLGLHEWGKITKVRYDSSNEPIFTVLLDNPGVTPDGIYYARACEIKEMKEE